MAFIKDTLDGIKAALNIGEKPDKTFTGMVRGGVTNQPQWKEWDDLRAIQEGFKASTYVYKAIGWKAGGFAQIGMNLVTYDEGGNRIMIDNHPILDLWDRPNPFMSGADFRERIVQFLELSGNAPIFKQRGVGGEVIALYPVAPAYLTPIEDSSKVLAGWLYANGTNRIEIAPEDLIHIQHPDPANPLWGTSPLKVVARTVDTDTQAVLWNKTSMQNRAVPDGVMTANDTHLTDAQYNQAISKWQEQQSSAANSHKTIFLSGNWTYQQMANTAVEMDFIASRKMTREEITAAFGVPLILLGILDNATYSNYKEARLSFWEDTEQPMIDKLMGALTFGLAREWSEDLYIEADYSRIPALKEKQLAMVQQARGFMELGYSRNEVNAKLDLGFDNHASGNTRYLTSSLVPEEYAGAMHLDITDEGEILNDPTEPSISRDLADLSASLSKQAKQLKSFRKAAAPKQSAEELYRAAEIKEWKRIERKRAPFDTYFLSTVKKQFKREQQEVMALLKSKGVSAARNYIKSNKNRSEWRKAYTSFYRRIIPEFGAGATEDIKSLAPTQYKDDWSFDPYAELVQQWVKKFAARKVTEVLDTTKTMLSITIAKALELDEEGNAGGMLDVQKAISKLYLEHFDKYRSTVIARTEVAGSSNFALFAAGQQAPFTTDKTWVNSGDDRVRDKHNFRETVPSNKKFKNGLMFPADPDGSAAEVIQCRCTMRYKRHREGQARP